MANIILIRYTKTQHLLHSILSTATEINYRGGTLVYELNLFHDFGKELPLCLCGKDGNGHVCHLMWSL